MGTEGTVSNMRDVQHISNLEGSKSTRSHRTASVSKETCDIYKHDPPQFLDALKELT